MDAGMQRSVFYGNYEIKHAVLSGILPAGTEFCLRTFAVLSGGSNETAADFINPASDRKRPPFVVIT